MFGTITRTYTYLELIFLTIPGFTGVVLLLILFAMYLTSLDIVKVKYFEWFSYIHLLYTVYMIFLPLHGCNFWLNFGFP